MYCKSCGSEIAEGSKFCENCGVKQEFSNPSTSYTAPPPPSQQYSAPQQSPPSYSYQPKTESYTPNTNIYNSASYQSNNEPMSVGQYLIMSIILVIPFVNFIMLLIWSFGKNVNLNKKNYSRAALVFLVIGIFLYIVLLRGIIGSLNSFV